MTQCLYCPATSEQPFNEAEHVIPQAFGTFESREGNLTLHNVCPDCNGYFGRNLEQHFGRDTGDAFLRLLTGLKPVEDAAEVGGRRLTFRIDDRGSEYHDSWVTLAHNPEQGLVMDAPPQAAFRRADEAEWRWYRERDLTADRAEEFRKCQFRIYGSPDDHTRIAERLRTAGVEINDAIWTDVPEEDRRSSVSWVEVRYSIDDLVLRTVAKIAFNYLARVTEDRVRGFVKRPEFEEIRQFIRHGTKPAWNVVSISDKKMLLGDSRRFRITNGHLIGVSWPDPQRPPIGKVSLFNQITYVVQFSESPPGIWWELDSGHHFDIQSRRMSKLASVNPLLLSIRRV